MTVGPCRRVALGLAAWVVASAGARGAAAQAPDLDSLLSGVSRLRAPMLSPDGRRVAYQRVDADSAAATGTVWVVESSGGEPQRIGNGADPAWSPDGRRLAYRTSDGTIAIATTDAGATATLIPGTTGATSFRWSPDGRFIGFTGLRPRDAEPAGRLDVARGFGGERRGQRLFVVPASGGMPRQVSPDSFDIGAANGGTPDGIPFDWVGDASIVFAASIDGRQSYLTSALYALEVGGGPARRLTTVPGYWHSPVVSPDGRSVAYTGFAETSASYRAGDVMIMRVDGSASRAVASGLDRDPIGLHWSDGQTLWFHAQDRGTVNTFIVNTRTGRVQPGSNGAHRLVLGSVNRRANLGVVVRSTPDAPDEVYRFPLGRPEQLTQVTRVHEALAAALPRGETEEIEFRSRDGTLVHGWLTRPPQYDPATRGPLVVMLHDGPHAMFDAAFDRAVTRMAARGYLVLRLNPRGSTGYGTDFGNRLTAFPSADVDDVLDGVADVVRQGIVDTTRVSLRGCGSGAVTALVALTRQTFSRAIVECPARFIAPTGEPSWPTVFSRAFRTDLIDWLAASPLRDVGRVRTPVMFVVDGDDPRSAEDQRAAWYRELRLRGVPVAWVDIGAGDDWLAVERTVAWWLSERR